MAGDAFIVEEPWDGPDVACTAHDHPGLPPAVASIKAEEGSSDVNNPAASGWFVSVVVDYVDDGAFVVEDDGPYDTKEEALIAGIGHFLRWAPDFKSGYAEGYRCVDCPEDWLETLAQYSSDDGRDVEETSDGFIIR